MFCRCYTVYMIKYRWLWLLGGMLLLGALIFWFASSSIEEPQDVFGTEANEEVAATALEDMTLVVQQAPQSIDFVSLAKKDLATEVIAEQQIVAKLINEPLQQLEALATRVRTGIQEQSMAWCEGYPAADVFSINVDQYREQQAGERSIRGGAEREVSYAEWDAWLLRLAEAKADRKKEQKAVGAFQEAFNSITDEYDQLLDGEKERLFGLMDKKVLAESRQYWPSDVYRVFDAQAFCSDEEGDISHMRSLETKVITWERTIKQAIQSVQLVQKELLAIPLGDTVFWAEQEKLSAQFRQALAELTQVSIGEE